MAESEGNTNEGAQSSAHLSSTHISSYEEMKEANTQESARVEAAIRQATYDAMEGQQQGTKSLRVPDGSWGKAHYVYPQKTHTGQGRSRYSGRSYGHKKTSSHTAHPTLHTPPHWSDTPYSKGNDGMNWWERFKQRWGLVW
jgi:hypothetical protein